MRLFKTLKYKHVDKYWNEDVPTDVEMYVPGVNSGVYDRALVITMRGTNDMKLFKNFLFRTRRRRVHLSITLPSNMVEALRDECNQILELVK